MDLRGTLLTLLALLVIISTVYADMAPVSDLPGEYDFTLALVLTIFIELFVGLLFLRGLEKRNKVLRTILLGNIITLPIVWFIIQPIIAGFHFRGATSLFSILFFSESFAILFEGGLIHLLNKEVVDLKKSLLLSLIMNICSLVLGIWIYLMLVMLFLPLLGFFVAEY
ncbi:MAG: hypothetical protein ABIG39_05270 [Candidatus Micrarchaeota archaeon]